MFRRSGAGQFTEKNEASSDVFNLAIFGDRRRHSHTIDSCCDFMA